MICKCGKTKYPIFNFEGLKPEYCSACKKHGMINIKYINRKCKCKCGKTKYPTFNFEGLTPEYCSACKKHGMINVCKNSEIINKKIMKPLKIRNKILKNNNKCKKNYRCKCGKTKYPIFNFEGMKPEYCSTCKEPGMIVIYKKNYRCKCGKSQPCFNFDGMKPEYCGKCKEPGMININKKNYRCKCGKSQSSFNFEGMKPEYCGKCKEPGMINIKKNKQITKSLKIRNKISKKQTNEMTQILAHFLCIWIKKTKKKKPSGFFLNINYLENLKIFM